MATGKPRATRSVLLLCALAGVAVLASACPKKYRGKTDPTSDTPWHRCEVAPEKREGVGGGPGALRFSVTCTAKETLWIHDIEAVLYEGKKPSNLGTRALLGEEERIDLEAGKQGVREGSFEVADVNKPWVVKVRILFGYPSKLGVERMDEEMAAMEKEQCDHPEKFKLQLDAAFQ